MCINTIHLFLNIFIFYKVVKSSEIIKKSYLKKKKLVFEKILYKTNLISTVNFEKLRQLVKK